MKRTSSGTMKNGSLLLNKKKEEEEPKSLEEPPYEEPELYDGVNEEKYRREWIQYYQNIGDIEAKQDHEFVDSYDHFKTVNGRIFAPLYYDLPTEAEIIAWIDINDNEFVISDQHMKKWHHNKKISDFKLKKISIRKTKKGYTKTWISKKQKDYMLHKMIFHAALNIPINLVSEFIYKYDVDHKIGGKIKDNSIKNLQLLNKKLHNKKTSKDNPNRSKKAAFTKSIPIIQYKDKEKTEIIKTFPTLEKAGKLLKIGYKAINSAIENNTKLFNSYWAKDFEFHVRNHPIGKIMLENFYKDGHEFKEIICPDTKKILKGYHVSSNLIIKMNNGRWTIGEESDTFKQKHKIMINGKSYLIYRLVCSTFNGPSPGENYVVMHENDNCDFITNKNLKWGTRSQNVTDALGIKINCRNIKTKEIKIYDSLTVAAEENELKYPTITGAYYRMIEKGKKSFKIGLESVSDLEFFID